MSRAQPSLRLVPLDPLPANKQVRNTPSNARYVAATALRLLGRDDDVDDVVREVFVAVP